MEVCKKLYDRNPDIYYIFVKDIEKDLIVGYMNVMLVIEEYFKLFEEGKLFDLDIPDEAIIVYDGLGVYKLCLISIAIYKEYQDSDVIKLLMYSFEGKLIKLAKKGIYFKEFLAEAISYDGEKFCRNLGMKQVNVTMNGSKIMKVDWRSIKDMNIVK